MQVLKCRSLRPNVGEGLGVGAKDVRELSVGMLCSPMDACELSVAMDACELSVGMLWQWMCVS